MSGTVAFCKAFSVEVLRPFFPPSPLPESPALPDEAPLPRPSTVPPDGALPLWVDDSGVLLLLSTTFSSVISLGPSVLVFASPSVVSSEASLVGFEDSFPRDGDVENLELPAAARIEGRTEAEGVAQI